MLNEDYRDMLHALSDEKIKFMLVGAYALENYISEHSKAKFSHGICDRFIEKYYPEDVD